MSDSLGSLAHRKVLITVLLDRYLAGVITEAPPNRARPSFPFASIRKKCPAFVMWILDARAGIPSSGSAAPEPTLLARGQLKSIRVGLRFGFKGLWGILRYIIVVRTYTVLCCFLYL